MKCETRNAKPETRRASRFAAERRGVLLLVILSLLFMFVLIAITYVLVTTRHLTISRQYGRLAATGHAQQSRKELDEAMLQVLRGAAPAIDPTTFVEHYRSPIGPHSLLEDLYGATVHFQLNFAAASTANQQLLEISAIPDPNFPSFTHRPDDGFFAGLVLTMTSGPAKGLSTRIVWSGNTHASPAPKEVMFRVLPINNITPAANDKFIVNSRPFTGTGFGFDPETGRPDAIYDLNNTQGDFTSVPWALLPNPLSYDPAPASGPANPYYPGETGSGTDRMNGNTFAKDYSADPTGKLAALYASYSGGVPPFGGIGGANEDYDAVDYQNMALAWVPAKDPAATNPPDRLKPEDIIPSFHRPDLANFFQASVGSTYQNLWNDPTFGPDLHRKVILRPIGQPSANPDHPNFTGSNPNYPPNHFISAANQTWDVDNDGDGVTDSVWLDLGYPVHSTADGRLYKPLFAILCIDLDGRVNVNAHGNATQTVATVSPVGPFAGGAAVQLPVGSGFGPADIYPGTLIPNSGTARTDFINALLWGDSTTVYAEGRYGEYGTGTAAGGRTNLDDKLSALRLFNYPPLTILGAPYTSCMAPADVWGRRVVGLDFRGQPLFAPVPNTDVNYPNYFANETFDDPYEIDLSASAPRPGSGAYPTASPYDNPFTAYELERILRAYDIDTPGLAPRLEKLIDYVMVLSGMTTSQRAALWSLLQKQLTTDSFDIPAPPAVVPYDMRGSIYLQQQARRAFNIKDLLRARIADGRGFVATDYPLSATTKEQEVEADVSKMLSWDLRAGRRMNINRPLGDGRDSNGNGVVDEPTSAELSQEGQTTATNQSIWAQQYTSGVNFELDNGLYYGVDVDQSGTPDRIDQGLMARQLMARHLYVLVMMLHNSGIDQAWSSLEVLTPLQKQQLLTRRIAQWAVNVVDFMDPDSIMTPFEYDVEPFKNNGTFHANETWEADGIIDDGSGTLSPDDNIPTNPDRRLVWGCEAPALLLTETLAFHDKRVKDTDFDTGSSKTVNDTPPDSNNDFDQVRIPQGSAFFELYCPSNPNLPAESQDLYTFSGSQWYLDLNRMTPDGNDPVWRVVISGPTTDPSTGNPKPENDLLTRSNTFPESATFETDIPPDASMPANATLPVTPERYIWLSETAPQVARPNRHLIYWQRRSAIYPAGGLLGRGQYGVVGPREVTRIGWTDRTGGVAPYNNPNVKEPSRHKIVLYPPTSATPNPANQAQFFDDGAAAVANYPKILSSPPAANDTIQQPLAILVGAGDATSLPNGTLGPTPGSWNLANFPTRHSMGIGISVSEPTIDAYYQEPTVTRPAFDGEPNVGGLVYDCYGNLDETGADKFLDQPLDKNTGVPLQGKLDTGTYFNFKSVLLQRLANPLANYNQNTNPYLTVDWMPIDVTVFKGDYPDPKSPIITVTADPDDSNPNPNVHFASRQRGDMQSYKDPTLPVTANDNTNFNLWMSAGRVSASGFSSREPAKTTADTGATYDPYFNHKLKYYNTPATPLPTDLESGEYGALTLKTGLHTLGFLNASYGYPATGAVADLDVVTYPQLAQYVGDPRKPFPWIVWNNRPYNSVYELQQVPTSSSGRLYWEFGMVDTAATTNPYNGNPGTDANLMRFPFSHLLNFVSSSNESPIIPSFGRIFDYLEVPSPFVGTDKLLTPGSMASGMAGADYLHPPFDVVSNFRDPGRVNINTITSQQVWEAVAGATGPTWPEFEAIRHGIRATATADNYPTAFANPFRSYSAGDMVPRIAYPPHPLPPSDADFLRHRGANNTLFRAARAINGAVDSTNLGDPDDVPNPVLPALLDSTSIGGSQSYKDAERNSYFMYQGLDRLANLVTTHSNVYAVWVTVGYFEVTPAPGSPYNPLIYPDGYQLGQELGMDTGDVDRHRAFYIIDRSIPVGYERGQNHNVEKAILLKRFIE